MTTPADALENTLSQILLGHPYDINSRHPERFLIDHLVEMTQDWEMGDVSIEELEATFKEHLAGQFDLRAWMQDQPEYN